MRSHRPKWMFVLGGVVALPMLGRDASRICGRVIKGLCRLGVDPGGATPPPVAEPRQAEVFPFLHENGSLVLAGLPAGGDAKSGTEAALRPLDGWDILCGLLNHPPTGIAQWWRNQHLAVPEIQHWRVEQPLFWNDLAFSIQWRLVELYAVLQEISEKELLAVIGGLEDADLGPAALNYLFDLKPQPAATTWRELRVQMLDAVPLTANRTP